MDTSRDWIEDAGQENGNYSCHCVHCHLLFVGYKRRVTCRACYEEQKAEQTRREALLSYTGLSSYDWVLTSPQELAKERAGYADLLLRYHVTDKVRRDLTKQVDDLLFQMQCAHTMDMGFHANHPMLKDVRAVVKESQDLDTELAAKRDEGNPL